VSLLALLLVGLIQASPPTLSDRAGEPLAKSRAEDLLRSGEVVETGRIPVGVSRPRWLIVTDGTRTARAVWKTIDAFEPLQRLARGKPMMSFQDSYKNEIASYELDKLLGLGLVPPTVERRIDGEVGALQLWVEDTTTEWKRLEEDIHPSDIRRWNEQMYTVRLFHQLIADSDYNNGRNLLVDSDFNLYMVDSSRAFGPDRKLRRPGSLNRFSSQLLRRLQGLDEELLESRLGRWLSQRRIRALLVRRDLILDRARVLVEEQGEDAVLFP
jgi:hypothetical protein